MKKFVYFDNHLGHVYLTRSGDIQIGMVHRKERLDVEVIRARGLVGKPGNKQTPGDNAVFLLPLNKDILDDLLSSIYFFSFSPGL